MAGCRDDPRAPSHPGKGVASHNVSHLPHGRRKAWLFNPSTRSYAQRSLIQPFSAGHAVGPLGPTFNVGVDLEDELRGSGDVDGCLEAHATYGTAATGLRRQHELLDGVSAADQLSAARRP